MFSPLNAPLFKATEVKWFVAELLLPELPHSAARTEARVGAVKVTASRKQNQLLIDFSEELKYLKYLLTELVAAEVPAKPLQRFAAGVAGGWQPWTSSLTNCQKLSDKLDSRENSW